MIIQSQAVTMSSSHSYTKVESQTSLSMTSQADKAATIDISDQSKSLLTQLREAKEEQEKKTDEDEQRQKEDQRRFYLDMMPKAKPVDDGVKFSVRSKEEMELEMLRRILDVLRHGRGRGRAIIPDELSRRFQLLAKPTSLPTSSLSPDAVDISANGISVQENVDDAALDRAVNQRVWKMQKVTSTFFYEQEVTKFSSTGQVQTKDGRSLSFQVELEMSRSFMQTYERYEESSFILKDPLVINLDTDATEISDQKFFFDIDADGTEDEISELSAGSGFLTLDKNGDGEVNDGNELFGAKSGDGFKELSEYDKDGNGWIDEADAVFSRLKIWKKNEAGENELISLKDAGVGAIFLGNARTEFSLNQAETNETNGVVRKTGIYLRENGKAGTIQHVDMAL